GERNIVSVGGCIEHFGRSGVRHGVVNNRQGLVLAAVTHNLCVIALGATPQRPAHRFELTLAFEANTTEFIGVELDNAGLRHVVTTRNRFISANVLSEVLLPLGPRGWKLQWRQDNLRERMIIAALV